MKQIRFTETLLRDANQSLIATRMPYSDFESMLDDIDKAGYHSVECWGGATFDSCLRYLDEDPWERLRKIKSHIKNTKLQMLLRGQNLLGYKHYPDDVVRMFVAKSIENGIDIIRIFDALNDLRNIEVSVDETIKRGGHAQGTIVYTLSPIHNLEAYVKLGKDLENMGVSSVCIKDMAGIMSPQEAYDLVSALKQTIKVPVILHTHSTTGLASMTYLKAAEAGVDVIDTAICSMSGGTSQPGTETLDYVLRQMDFETGLDTAVLKSINDKVKPVRNEFIVEGKLDPLVLTTDSDALSYQIPGGMLSNLIAQLKAQNAMDKLPLVLEETPRVRKDLGYPPLVTPMSQMVGVQAATNVLVGQRYKNVGKEVKAYIKGEYGKAPGEIDPELIKLVLGDEKPIEERFAQTLAPAFEETKEKLKGIAQSDEDVLSYIAFPEVAMKFFENRENKRAIKVNYTVKRID